MSSNGICWGGVVCECVARYPFVQFGACRKGWKVFIDGSVVSFDVSLCLVVIWRIFVQSFVFLAKFFEGICKSEMSWTCAIFFYEFKFFFFIFNT